MKRYDKFVGKYVETVSTMNESYKVMMRGFFQKDTRLTYLRSFEMALNANMNTPLWMNPRYARVDAAYSLDGSREYVSLDKYQAYIMLYTEIMRDEGLLSKVQNTEHIGESTNEIFEVGN